MKLTTKNKKALKTATLAILTAILLCGILTCVSAAGSGAVGSLAPGGNVNTVDELVTALGGENNASVSSDRSTVYLSTDIILNAPIVFQSGAYRIVGRGCTIYRGFTDGAMFHLAAGALTNDKGEPISLPVLTLGSDIKLENQDLTEPDLILDGNSEGFTGAVKGPIIAILGKGEVIINPSTKLTNNHSAAPGGAIYLESFSQGDEVSPLDPTLYINGGEISGNSSTTEGGAIAAYGRLKGSPTGTIQINGCKIEGNTVTPTDATLSGRGGAIFSDGMRLVLSGCEINSNSADEGGALHFNHDTIISNCTINKNRANKGGGVAYIDISINDNQQTAAPANVSVISSYITENHSDGIGGVFVNNGVLILPAENSSYICNNTAKGDGAVVYNQGTFELNCGDIFYNSTSEGRGGIFNLGTVEFKGADMRLNTATVGGAIYNLGTLNFKKGCFSNNKCSVKNAPQIANLGKMSISGSFVIDEDLIGLFPITDESGNTTLTSIEITDKITTNVKIKIAIFKPISANETPTDIQYDTKSGQLIFAGLRRYIETAASRSVIVENGAGSYKINSDGTISFVFPLMPLGAWIGCTLGLIAIIAVTVVFIKKRKKSNNSESESENDVSENEDSEEQ